MRLQQFELLGAAAGQDMAVAASENHRQAGHVAPVTLFSMSEIAATGRAASKTSGFSA